MIITDVKAVYPQWQRPFSLRWQSHFWQIVVRVETDAGVVGHGYGGGGEPGVLVINQHLRHHLRGLRIDSPDDIARAWAILYRASLPYGRGGIASMALSGVDIALWDLLGQAEQKPVYELLGGLRKPRVRAYASGTEFTRYRDLGYTAIKFSHQWRDEADYDSAVHLAQQARQALGPAGLVMADCYMSWDATVTRRMAALLAEFDLFWLEDVLTPDDLEETASLRRQIQTTRLAGGEHEFAYQAYAAMARLEALDIWQPDVTWCGGLTAALRIVDLAQAHGIPVTPHRGGEVWALHLVAASDCMDLAEIHADTWRDDAPRLWLDTPPLADGCIVPPDRPGFGVRLNPDLL